FPPDRGRRGRACRGALARGPVQGIVGTAVWQEPTALTRNRHQERYTLYSSSGRHRFVPRHSPSGDAFSECAESVHTTTGSGSTPPKSGRVGRSKAPKADA